MQVIRNDSRLQVEAARLQMAAPIMLRTRADGLALMRSRWDAERRREH